MLEVLKRNSGKILLFFIVATVCIFIQHFIWQKIGLISYGNNDNLKELGFSFVSSYSIEILRFLGIGGIGICALFYESYLLGWQNCSLFRLLSSDSQSTKNDIGYFFLAVSGLHVSLAHIMSFGFLFFFQKSISTNLSINLFAGLNPVICFFFYYFINTFLFYCSHRVMHIGYFWNIHKVHHSATEMNILTPHRNHPLNRVVVDLLNAIPLTILGASFWQIVAYQILNGWYQQLVHTNYKWKNSFLCSIFISSQDHLIHHAKEKSLWNKNFGILVLWDKIFGTYEKYDVDKHAELIIGTDDEYLNNDNFFSEMFHIYIQFFKDIFKLKKMNS